MKRLNNKKIKVLDITYTILMRNGVQEDICLEKGGGYIDFYEKKIILDSFEWANGDPKSYGNTKELVKQCARHEIIHAFLFESGLNLDTLEASSWARNEEMVDWLAIQFHKIEKMFKKLKI